MKEGQDNVNSHKNAPVDIDVDNHENAPVFIENGNNG
jgi:hypothetical protein